MDLRRIPQQRLDPDGLEIDQTVDADWFCLSADDPKIVSDPRVFGNIERTGEEVVARITLEGRMGFSCSRCLEEFEEDFRQSWMLVPELEGDEDINLIDWVREELILNQPMTARCKPDCLGLCVDCGQNLNRESCACSTRVNVTKG